MRFTGIALLASTATAFKFPLSNGFPAVPKGDDLAKLFGHAGGPLPNGALPTKITPEAEVAFQLVALQEIFEVAYFTQLLKKVKAEEPGFKVQDKAYIQKTLRRIRAQEELHALGANGILDSVGAKTVGGCTYTFPAKNFDMAIELAETFTAVVLGVVPTIQSLLAADGGQEPALIPLIGSILAQEGEQTGWFRAYQGKVPSAAPFLTGGAAQFAYSALRLFLNPGSCPLYPDVPFFPAITVETPPAMATSQTLTFSTEGTVDPAKMEMAYLSGQSLPFLAPISNVKKSGKISTFDAKFPFNKGFAKGLSIGAVIKKTEKAPESAADVAAAAAYGPALILLQ